MAKRVALEPTLQASLDLQAMITDVTSRNRHVSARALWQGEGIRTLEVEVSDGDVVKVANSGFFLERVLPNDDLTDLESDRVQSGKGFATTSLVDSTTAGHKGREQ